MKRRGALAGAVLVVATLFAACGGSSTGDAAVSIETLQAAASNSQAAESSRFTMEITVDVEGEPTTVSVDGLRWAEIDFPRDLEAAQSVVWALEEASRAQPTLARQYEARRRTSTLRPVPSLLAQ